MKWFMLLVLGFVLFGWFFPAAFGVYLVAQPFFLAGLAIGERLFVRDGL